MNFVAKYERQSVPSGTHFLSYFVAERPNQLKTRRNGQQTSHGVRNNTMVDWLTFILWIGRGTHFSEVRAQSPRRARPSATVRSTRRGGHRTERNQTNVVSVASHGIVRHMLALSTYLGHAHLWDTYYYLHATPKLMQETALAAETLFQGESL